MLIGFAVKSDFILATAGEELGLAGLSAIFLLYGLLVERGYRAGLALRDPFGRLLAVGLASLVALQVFVIAGGVTGLIPLTGMAMPFLAQGGSSVVTNWAIVALLVRLATARAGRPRRGCAPVTRHIRHAALFCALLLVALLVNAARVQVLQAGDYEANPANRRARIARYQQPRGDILVGGRPVTGSRDTGEHLRYERTYTDGPLYAPVTGFASQEYGTTLLEHAEDGAAVRRRPAARRRSLCGTSSPAPAAPAATWCTTIDPAAQRAAYEGLGGRKGAVAAIEPSTGRILALVSAPSYDPALLSGNGPAARAAWARLNADPDRPMLNRAVQQTYPPGSTFKVVTAAAALDAGVVKDLDAADRSPDPYRLPGTTTRLTNGSEGCENATLRDAFVWSCNTVFAKLGVDTGVASDGGRRRRASASTTRGLRIPVPGGAQHLRHHGGPGAVGAVVDRAVQHAGHAAADGDGRGGRGDGGQVRAPYLVERTTRAGGGTVSDGGVAPCAAGHASRRRRRGCGS